tara:strand:- start:276 stop:767 length:492 start_codon:yes stop_codon:yes gene_type:complete
MTDKQRDRGRAVAILILLIILLSAMLSGCSDLLYRGNNVMVTHVLALTEMGDTVKIRIQDIQPHRTYNVVGYDFVRWQDNRFYNPYNDYYYDYRYYNDRWRYHGKTDGTYGSITPYPNVNNNAPITVGNPTQSYGGNTTGGAGAPVASNPVTSGGGSSRGKNN